MLTRLAIYSFVKKHRATFSFLQRLTVFCSTSKERIIKPTCGERHWWPERIFPLLQVTAGRSRVIPCSLNWWQSHQPQRVSWSSLIANAQSLRARRNVPAVIMDWPAPKRVSAWLMKTAITPTKPMITIQTATMICQSIIRLLDMIKVEHIFSFNLSNLFIDTYFWVG